MKVLSLAGGVAFAALVALVVMNIPDIKRYVRISTI